MNLVYISYFIQVYYFYQEISTLMYRILTINPSKIDFLFISLLNNYNNVIFILDTSR